MDSRKDKGGALGYSPEEIQEAFDEFQNSGQVGPALLVGFDQRGRWLGFGGKEALGAWYAPLEEVFREKLGEVVLSPDQIESKDEKGRRVLLTSYFQQDKNEKLTYDVICGSLITFERDFFCSESLQEIGGDLLCREREVNFPLLEKVGGYIHFCSAEKVSMEKLVEVGGGIAVESAIKIHLPILKTAGSFFDLRMAKVVDLSSLESVGGDFHSWDAQELNLPSLRSVGGVFWVTPSKLSAPLLKSVGGDVLFGATMEVELSKIQIGGLLHVDLMEDGSAQKVLKYCHREDLKRWANADSLNFRHPMFRTELKRRLMDDLDKGGLTLE